MYGFVVGTSISAQPGSLQWSRSALGVRAGVWGGPVGGLPPIPGRVGPRPYLGAVRAGLRCVGLQPVRTLAHCPRRESLLVSPPRDATQSGAILGFSAALNPIFGWLGPGARRENGTPAGAFVRHVLTSNQCQALSIRICPLLASICRSFSSVEPSSVGIAFDMVLCIQRSKPKTQNLHTLSLRAYSFRHIRSSP